MCVFGCDGSGAARGNIRRCRLGRRADGPFSSPSNRLDYDQLGAGSSRLEHASLRGRDDSGGGRPGSYEVDDVVARAPVAAATVEPAGLYPANARPHCTQKREPRSFGVPHCGQSVYEGWRPAVGEPQCGQNPASPGTMDPQDMQFLVETRGPPRSRSPRLRI